MAVNITVAGQPIQLLDIPQLAVFNDKTRKADSFLKDSFFTVRRGFPNAKEVNVGELQTTAAPLAPFVTPQAQARNIAGGATYVARSVPCAYLKPAQVIRPGNVQDMALVSALRDAGLIGRTGQMSMAEQMLVAQVGAFKYLRESIDNRVLMMATDILLTGKTTMVSDDFPSVLVDYQRDASLTFAPTTKWDQAGATPITDIQTMINRVIDASGMAPVAYLTSSAVLSKLLANQEFKDRYVATKPANDSVPIGLQLGRQDQAVVRGYLDGVQVITYDATHTLTGSAQRFIPATAFLAIADTRGSINQCAIQHMDALGMALDYFDYMVVEKDPSGMKLITESAPLVAPGHPNGVCVATVL